MHWSGGGQFNPAFGLVNGPVKPRSNLVKLGQSSPNSGKCIPNHILGVFWVWWTLVGSGTAWSNLGQTWSKFFGFWEMYPRPHLGGFFGYGGPPVGSETAWSNLGQTWSTLVKLGQPWENLVRFQEMCPRPRFEVI